MKDYYIQNNIGKAKYAVSFCDGIKTHEDRSPFYDIALFKNKIKLSAFIASLKKQQYKERVIQL